MPNKNSAVDEFLSSEVVKGDEQPLVEPEKNPFADLGVEQKGDEPSQSNNDAGEKKDEDKVPYHQDPKLRKFIAKEIAKATEGMSPKRVQEVKEEISQSDDPLAALTAVIGNDTPEKVHALKTMKIWMDGLEQKALAGVREREAERQAEIKAREELETGFTNIEENFDVDLSSNTPQAKKTRAEFLDFMERVAPKNAQGEILAYPDFEQTFSLFQEFQKKAGTPNRAKDLASRSMERSGDASKPQIPADSSWKAVDKFFAGLKGK